MKSKLFSVLSLWITGTHAAAAILGLDGSNVILDSFIVVLKPKISDRVLSSHLSFADGIIGAHSTAASNSSFAFGSFKGYHLKASRDIVAQLAERDEVSLLLLFGRVRVWWLRGI